MVLTVFMEIVCSFKSFVLGENSKTDYLLCEPILCRWSLSIPSENIRQSEVYHVFRGYRKRPDAGNGLIGTLKTKSKKCLQ